MALSRALGTKPSWIDTFIGTLLRAANANVIAVDWVYGSTGVYFSAVENVVKLGLEISRFLSKLLVGVKELGVSFDWEEKGDPKKESTHEGELQGGSRATSSLWVFPSKLNFTTYSVDFGQAVDPI